MLAFFFSRKGAGTAKSERAVQKAAGQGTDIGKEKTMNIKGSIVALVTPFHPDGTVNYCQLEVV